MKIISKALFAVMFFMCINLICGCGKEKETIQATAQYTLMEYDLESKKEGNQITNEVVECGKDYKLSFDFDFGDLKKVIGKKKIEVTMQVQLGIFDNDANVQLFAEGKETKDFKCEKLEDGLWEVKFKISHKKLPDFSKLYFVLNVDSLEEESAALGDVITVTFPEEKYPIKIDKQLTEYQIPLQLKKGVFEFTREGNVGEGNIIIKVPDNCKEVTLMIYKDASKTELCGIQRFGEESFFGNMLAVMLSDYIVEYVGKEKYEDLTSSDSPSVYLQIIAEGGESYQNAVVDMEYEFK